MAATVTVKGDTLEAKTMLTIAGFTGVTNVSVIRVEYDGSETTIRAGAAFLLANGGGFIEDYEVPLDRAVSYRVNQVTPVGAAVATSPGITIVSEHDYTYLKDPAIPTRNMRLDYIEDIRATARSSRAGVFDIIDRANPVVVTGIRQGWTGDLTMWTYTEAERTSMEILLGRGAVLLLSTPPEYGVGNAYVYVGDVACDRLGTVGTEQTRHWTLPLTAVDRPATLATMPLGTRWIDVKNRWATCGDLYATGMTWTQLLNYTPP